MPCERILRKEKKLEHFMHINNCNTGEVEIVMLHRIKIYKWQLKPFRILKRLRFC